MRPISALTLNLASVSSVAVATAMLVPMTVMQATVAQAQSFQAIPTAVFGTVDVNTGPNVTTIDVNSNSAVINWLPTDNPAPGQPHIFQPAGTTATFTGTSGSGADFAVLNRIIPTDQSRPIQLNGTVISNLQISGTTDPGGQIFFYSPGGIIIGSTASFNVGSLTLTTLDLEYNSSTGSFDTSGSYAFNPVGSSTTNPLVPGSEVRVLAGAQINTTVNNAYVALVAPSVYNEGTITADGAVALVAADSATIRFAPSGLFDIAVTSGTSATGIVLANNGTITGPGAESGETRRIYMVAVPKNDAITMAIGSGSSLGFDVASAADVFGNTIILSGGHDVAGGVQSPFRSSGGGTGNVSVNGLDADITSNFRAQVTGGINLGSVSATGLDFAADVSLVGSGASSSVYANGGEVTVGGSLVLIGDAPLGFDPAIPANGQDVSVRATGGSITVDRGVLLSANGQGADALVPGTTGAAGTGGFATLLAEMGGQINITMDATLLANGTGGSLSVNTPFGNGGNGLGGQARIQAIGGTNPSGIQIGGELFVEALGIGGGGSTGSGPVTATSGNGTGGSVFITSATGTAVSPTLLSVAGRTQINVAGLGGDASDGIAGVGTGGFVGIEAVNGGDINLHQLDVFANGRSGNALGFFGFQSVAAGNGGSIEIITSLGASDSSATFNGAVSLTAEGSAQFSEVGGEGNGGTVSIFALDGNLLDFTDSLTVAANGIGGFATTGSVAGFGGAARLRADANGQLRVGTSANITAKGLGGSLGTGGTHGDSVGGLAELLVSNGGNAQFSGTLDLNADANGGSVGSGGLAGLAQGGTAQVVGASGGVLNVTGITRLEANAFGGSSQSIPAAGLQGGDGRGGFALATFTGGTATFASTLELFAIGVGGDGGPTLSDSGGLGRGGVATLSAGTASTLGNGATVTVGGSSLLQAVGQGGVGYTAGAGIGGQANLFARQGSLLLNGVSAGASGIGGEGQEGGFSGNGQGGSVSVVAHNAIEGPSLLRTIGLDVFASGRGGSGSDAFRSNLAGSAGGNATGGSVLVAGSAGNGVLQTGNLQAFADALGGAGGSGDLAIGGNGGNAIGGTVQTGMISGIDTGTVNLGLATFGSVNADARATGGAGGAGGTGQQGGNGGNATGGLSTLVVEGAQVTLTGNGTWQANAIAASGGAGDGAPDGTGGNAIIGQPRLTVVGPQPTGTAFIVKSRANQPTQGGIVDAQELLFASQAIAGTGSTNGIASKGGRAVAFQVDNGAVTATQLSLFSVAPPAGSGSFVDPVSVTNSTVAVSGLFQLLTSSTTSLTLDQSSVTASSVAMQGANWVLAPVAPATLGTLAGTTAVTLTSGQNLVAYANLASQGSLSLNALGSINFGAVSALGVLSASAGTTLSLGDATSDSAIDLQSAGAMVTGNLTAGTSINLESLNNVTAGNLAAGTGNPSGTNDGLHTIAILSGGNIAAGTVNSASDIGMLALGDISIGEATAYDMALGSGGAVSTGGLLASNRILIGDDSMYALGQTAGGFDKELVFAATPVIRTPGSITINGDVSAVSFTAATQSTFTAQNISEFFFTTRAGALSIDAGGALTASAISIRNALDLRSNVSITTDNILSRTSTATINAPVINAGTVQGQTGIDILGQTVTTDPLISGAGGITATGTQTIATGSVIARGEIAITGGSQTTVGAAMSSTGSVAITSADALNSGGVIATLGGVRLQAGDGVTAGQGAITASAVQAGGFVQLVSGGALSSGALRSSTGGVKVVSLDSTVRTGSINASTDVLASAAQSLNIGGAINAPNVFLLAGSNISARDIVAGGVRNDAGQVTTANGRVLIAGAGMLSNSFLRSADQNYSALLVPTPPRAGGTVNLAGSSFAGSLISFSQGAMTGANINAFESLNVESGGLVTVAQRWTSPAVLVSSGDIRIIDNGSLPNAAGQLLLSGIRSTASGSVGLISLGSSPARIGDGIAGSGYALSSAEIGLVSAGELAIGAVDVATNPVDMQIGNLSLTAGGAIGSSILAGPTGRIVFGTGNRVTQTPGGAIRIVGNVTGTGFAATNVVEFASGRFELDAATGSLALSQTGTALGGTVEIAAANIHIASGAILDRLAADPFYAGHVDDLNNAAAVSRPEGVLRALGLDLFPTGTLYIQNTGTILDPAGFFADFEFTDVTAPANAAPASIAVIVNGKWQTAAGIVSGVAARDLVVENADTLALYTASSTVNGCALDAAACVTVAQELDPTPAITGQIAIVSNNVLGNTPQFTPEPAASVDVASGESAQATEEAQEEAEAAAAAAVNAENATSPIAPPPQMINSAPLDQKPPIDQPVAGSGNPSLIGSAVNENSAEGTAQ